RCNLTHSDEIEDFLPKYFAGGKFLRQAFGQFFWTDLVAFLGEIGVETVCEESGRVFPASDRAADVVAAFKVWLNKLNVIVHRELPVESLAIAGGTAVGVSAGDELIGADAVVLATGGRSYPTTGATGDGYRMAADAGHRVVPVQASLTPLETAGRLCKKLQGVSLTGVAVSAVTGKKTADERHGEILFTHFGLSGPAVLNLSRQVIATRRAGQKVAVSIDLVPSQTIEELDRRLERLCSEHGRKQAGSVLHELLPRRVASVAFRQNGIDETKQAAQLSAEERRTIAGWIKDVRMDVTGDRGFVDAITTAGGVDTRQVDPKTMESRVVNNLYFCGEVLDIDGESGGYNLQAAFSTGWVAGRSAALGGNRA
ncbi:aminoacetone oxidase family FAD-binding enzyme, partial [candidate division GN15 bacterium]|nr:aminoacetone oxidase family FAD-binding enzyme [candidate division GN15 bacterium]